MHHELLLPGNLIQVRNMLRLGLTITLTLSGVTLFLNKLDEMTYIDTPAFETEGAWLKDFLHLEEYANALGFITMSHAECPPEELPDGGERWWLCEGLDAELALLDSGALISA